MQSVAARHVKDIVTICAEHSPHHKAVVVFDNQCELAQLLTAAYRTALPEATFIDFDNVSPDDVLKVFATLQPRDLVVLVQSSSFRLVAFRIRVELFKRSIKVIEHPHLADILAPEIQAYIDSLAYDPSYYRILGPALKKHIDNAQSATIDSGNGEHLVCSGPLEPAKLNIGDYSGMHNIGGQFPIGEVFTEAKDLTQLNGRVRIFVFGDTQFRVAAVEQPITMVVEKGRVVDAVDSNDEFDRVLEQIRTDEKEVWIRELGLGLNPAFTQTRRVTAIGTYERMCGIHLSLGRKHGVYDKPEFRRKDGKYHVDVFAVTEKVLLDDRVIFQNGAWVV